MIKNHIQNLINTHRSDIRRLEVERTLPAIKVSKAVSFVAELYEKVRNAIDLEEDHLLRKRAIKRIMLRMSALKKGDAKDIASNIIREIIWAQYLSDYPVANSKIEVITQIIRKYQTFIQIYRQEKGSKIPAQFADIFYGIAAFEIDRVFVPYNHLDALVNSMFYFVKNKGIFLGSEVHDQFHSIQTYIAVHRALLKSDNENIAFHLIYNRFPNWINPSVEDIKHIVRSFDEVTSEVTKQLDYKISNKIQKEVVRQSISFKILDKIIRGNLSNIEEILQDPAQVDAKVDQVCEQEYSENKRRLNATIIRSIIYLFITKVLLAFIIEVPYELTVLGHINFVNLGINIFFPITSMFIIANSFSIPNEENTKVIKEMIRSILSHDEADDRQAFAQIKIKESSFNSIFKAIYFIIFIAIFAFIILTLYLLNFNVPGMFIFIIFFSTIFFFAAKLRNTATELKVINTNPIIISPLIDMFSAPLLILGKKLSEGASQLNVFTVILDFLIEAPFKTIIKVFEEWTHFIRETREEIV